MTKSPLLFFVACLAALVGAGCGSINTGLPSDPNRVIVGTINYRGDLTLPDDAEVVIRLIDPAGIVQIKNPANKDLPVTPPPKGPPVPVLVGEQKIKPSASGPIPFRLEYTADDELLRHGLNLEARISFNGRVRLRTVNFRAVTLGNSRDMHEVWVESVAR